MENKIFNLELAELVMDYDSQYNYPRGSIRTFTLEY